MDVAAAGLAASQIASAQRGQQAALAGLRGQQKQGQNIANLLTEAVGGAKQVAAAPSAPESAPSLDSSRGGSASAGNGRSTGRGSLINILA